MRQWIIDNTDQVAASWASILIDKCAQQARHLQTCLQLDKRIFFISSADVQIGEIGIKAVFEILRKRGFTVDYEPQRYWFTVSW